MDVTALSDVQLGHMLSVEALRREKRRRLAARPQAPANVEQDLEASAAPMVMEPTVGAPTREELDAAILAPITKEGKPIPGFDPSMGIGLSMSNPTDRAAYAQVFGDALSRDRERMKARVDARLAAGYRDPRQEAYNAETGVMPPEGEAGDTVMVNGVQVPVRMLDGAGRPMTTIGDERRAMEAAREAGIADRVSREAQEELARYGDGTLNFYRYSDDMDGPKETVSPNEWDAKFKQVHGRSMTGAERQLAAEQAANLEQRRGMEDRQAQQNRALSSRPGLRQLASDARDRRRLIANRAMLAGGSSGLRGGPGGNMGMFTALAMLNGVDPESIDAQEQALMQMLPINADRAKIEAAQNAQLTELGLRTAQGRGFQQPTGAAERLGNAQAAAAERAAEPEVAAIADISEGVYTSPEARAHLTAIGKQYDTNWFGGAGEDRKPELVQRLTQPPYSLTPERASEAADIALGTTRWWNRPF
jgi:hypothetical protein